MLGFSEYYRRKIWRKRRFRLRILVVYAKIDHNKKKEKCQFFAKPGDQIREHREIAGSKPAGLLKNVLRIEQ
jgi:hypothetical protein